MDNSLVRWSDGYNLGLAEIDEQHKSLVDLIGNIWQSIVNRSDPGITFALIGELETYTLAHFTAEETFMRVMNYPDFDAHKREHQSFIARIADEKSKAQKVGALSLDLMHFLRDWLINHILLSDKAYAAYLQQRDSSSGSRLKQFFKKFF